MDDWGDVELPDGPLSKADLFATIMNAFISFMAPLLLLGVPFVMWVRSGDDRSSDIDSSLQALDPEEVHRYAQALAVPFEDAERMLSEAMSDTAIEVLPKVFLGNAASSQNWIGLQRAGMTHVVNATTTLSNHFDGMLSYLRVPIDDSIDDDLTPHLERACRFMSEALEHGGSVLVHCQQGVSRSASVVLAFCMRERGMDLDAAREMVHRRKWIRPNEAFEMQLKQFEADVSKARGGKHAASGKAKRE